jgi:hypothetical protein
MTDWSAATTFRYGSIKRQMERVSSEQARRLRQTWIERVLDLLDDDNLITQVATLPRNDEGILFDCNFAPLVWDDPRIVFRLKQLTNNEVTVDLLDHEHTVSGKTFNRAQIRVRFEGECT